MNNLLKIIAIVFLLSSYRINYSQNFSQEYGKLNPDELTMQKYPADTGAEAIYIYDVGTSDFIINDYSFNIVFEQKFKIKIFTKAGYKYSEIEIPYYQQGDIYEKVTEIEAFTYNFENGMLRKTPLDVKNVYVEKINEYWNQKKFAMPDVKEGSIIEVKYVIDSPYKFNLHNWEFQHTIPTLYSEYVVKMVPFYDYVYICQGTSSFDFQTSYVDNSIPQQFGPTTFQYMIHKYVMKDVPAFKDESFITSKEDYIIKLDFQLAKYYDVYGTSTEVVSTWPKLNNELLKTTEFGKYMNACDKEAEKILTGFDLSNKNEMEKLEMIVNYVKSNYNWNEWKGIYSNKTCKQFLKEKTGNDAAINLFLGAMIKASGIESHPVLISTRDHGKIRSEYPFLSFFNYVISMAVVNNQTILLDGTRSNCRYDRIPLNCINEKGMVVNKDGNTWISLVNDVTSGIQEDITLSLNSENDSVIGYFSKTATEYDASSFRDDYENKIDKITDELVSRNYNIIDSIKTENYFDSQKPYLISFKISFPIDVVNNQLLFSPFLNEPISTNLFKEITRNYPIDMIYKKSRTYTSDITIPDGYKIKKIPENFYMNNKIAEIKYSIEQPDKQHLKVIGSYTFKEAVYAASAYINLKFYFNEIIKRFNDKIVLEKE